MHMADALISPAVGGAMWAVTAGLTVYSSKRLKEHPDDARVPLMGVLGAFVFAAQMINFTIPATGSSGHLGGGMILAILLGPHAAFLTLASVLAVQALFFADGGLLALGCNIFNLGFYTCFLAYPFIYKRIAGEAPDRKRVFIAAALSAVAGLQFGAFSVVMETIASGISELPFRTFLALMQPIHLAIGMVEGFVTAAVVLFVGRARPEFLVMAADSVPMEGIPLRKVLAALAAAAIVTGGGLSWFASSRPDGLEWSMAKIAGNEELSAPESGIHEALANLQEKTSFLPDYGFKKTHGEGEQPSSWPNPDMGTSVSGLVGGGLTLALSAVIGLVLRRASTLRR